MLAMYGDFLLSYFCLCEYNIKSECSSERVVARSSCKQNFILVTSVGSDENYVREVA